MLFVKKNHNTVIGGISLGETFEMNEASEQDVIDQLGEDKILALAKQISDKNAATNANVNEIFTLAMLLRFMGATIRQGMQPLYRI